MFLGHSMVNILSDSNAAAKFESQKQLNTVKMKSNKKVKSNNNESRAEGEPDNVFG